MSVQVVILDNGTNWLVEVTDGMDVVNVGIYPKFGHGRKGHDEAWSSATNKAARMAAIMGCPVLDKRPAPVDA